MVQRGYDLDLFAEAFQVLAGAYLDPFHSHGTALPGASRDCGVAVVSQHFCLQYLLQADSQGRLMLLTHCGSLHAYWMT